MLSVKDLCRKVDDGESVTRYKSGSSQPIARMIDLRHYYHLNRRHLLVQKSPLP